MILSLVVVTIIIAGTLIILVMLADSIEEENRMIENSIESAHMYDEALEERTKKIRRLRHDALGLLQAIESVSRQSDDNSHSAAKAAMNGLQLGMPLLNAVISQKQMQCESSGIVFSIGGQASASGSDAVINNRLFDDIFDEADICLLIQNLLENAYEANLRIKSGQKRFMSLTVSQKEGQLTINTVNSIDRGESISFLTRKKNPELHGIGMKVIYEIAAKYNGSVELKKERSGNTVEITVLLDPVVNKHLN